MDLNLVVLCGQLAVDPEIRVFDSGTRLARLLVTTRTDHPTRRVDVVPVTVWDPADEIAEMERGDRVWATGAVQRRFWEASDGRRSRIEVVATQVTTRDGEEVGV